MIESDALIAEFHSQSRDQVRLATIAETEAVAAMHIDLAMFTESQAQVADALCGYS